MDELLTYIYNNYLYVRDALAHAAADIGVAPLQGTYLLWLNFETRFKTHAEMFDFGQNKCGIAPDYGSWFGGDQFASFIRLNLATSRKNVETATNAIIRELK